VVNKHALHAALLALPQVGMPPQPGGCCSIGGTRLLLAATAGAGSGLAAATCGTRPCLGTL
jgi:hypothetical protein